MVKDGVMPENIENIGVSLIERTLNILVPVTEKVLCLTKNKDGKVSYIICARVRSPFMEHEWKWKTSTITSNSIVAWKLLPNPPEGLTKKNPDKGIHKEVAMPGGRIVTAYLERK